MLIFKTIEQKLLTFSLFRKNIDNNYILHYLKLNQTKTWFQDKLNFQNNIV